ncbi:MAG: hypothetical protein K6F00_11425 [Lachnospiraceae bacterium]|nr:hypothetical protein [Lachnospiraceae bacterium]
MILFFINLFSKIFKIKEEESRANYENNKNIPVSKTGDGYIERQELMSPFRYGVQKNFLSNRLLGGKALDASVNSCEIIAVYNVLKYFGKQKEFADLIADFEKRGVSLYGYFGTSLTAVYDYILKTGLFIRRLKIKEVILGSTVSDERMAYILCGENVAGDIRSMIHTIALTKEGNILRSHNESGSGGLYPNLYEAVLGFSGGKGNVLAVYEIVCKEVKQD